MVGAGKAEGAMDAGNMLKPALARGELHCVGATTLDEYQAVRGEGCRAGAPFPEGAGGEPSVEDTIAILRGLKERYELHHGADHRPGHRRGGPAPTATSPTASCRTRPSTSSTRRRPASGWQIDSKPEEMDASSAASSS